MKLIRLCIATLLTSGLQLSASASEIVCTGKHGSYSVEFRQMFSAESRKVTESHRVWKVRTVEYEKAPAHMQIWDRRNPEFRHESYYSGQLRLRGTKALFSDEVTFQVRSSLLQSHITKDRIGLRGAYVTTLFDSGLEERKAMKVIKGREPLANLFGHRLVVNRTSHVIHVKLKCRLKGFDWKSN